MWRVFLCCTVRKYGRHESHYYGLDLTKTASTGCSGCDRQAANHPKGRPSADDKCGRNESERLKCFVIYGPNGPSASSVVWSQWLIQELGIQPGELPTTSAPQKLMERHQVMPSHVVPLAMWTWEKRPPVMGVGLWTPLLDYWLVVSRHINTI